MRAAFRLVAKLFGGTLLAVYYLVTRAVIAVLAAYLVLYFLAGSRPVKQALQTLVAESLPGSMTAASVQWGPLPWHLRLADVRIHGARGEDVARVKGVEVTIDWPGTAAGLWSFLDDPTKNPLALRFHRVELLDPWARIEVDQDYLVGIERAFVIDDEDAPTQPDAEPGPDLDIRVAVVRVINGGALVTAPGFHLEAFGAQSVTDFALVGREGHMFYGAPRTTVARVDMRFDAFSHLPEPLTLTATDLIVDDYAWSELGFSWRHATGHLPYGTFEGYGELDAAPDTPTWSGGGRVTLEAGAPLTAELFRGAIDGPLTLALDGGGDVEQVAVTWQLESPSLHVAALELSDLFARGRISPRATRPPAPNETRLHAIHIDALQAGLNGGQVRVTDFDWEPWRPPGAKTSLGGPRDLTFAASFEHVAFPGFLRWPAFLPVPRASGEALVTHRPREHGTPSTFEVELAGGRLDFDAAPLPGLPLTWTLGGTLVHTLGAAPDRLGSDIPAREVLDLTGLQLDGGDIRARLAGRVDLSTGALDLEPYLRIGSLAPLVRGHIDREVPTTELPAGRVVLKAARLTGTLADPTVTATLNWTNARTSGRDLGQISGLLQLSRGVLTTRELESRTAVVDPGEPDRPRRRMAGKLEIDGRVALFAPGAKGDSGPAPLSSRPFSLAVKNVDGLVAAAFTDAFGPEARLRVENGAVSGTLEDPVGSLSGGGRVRLSDAELAGERKVALEGTLAIRPGLGLSLTDATLTLQSGARWTGQLGLEPGPLSLSQRKLEAEVELGPTRLGSIAALDEATPDVDGIVTGRLALSGTPARPEVEGTLALDEVVLGHLELGSARLAIATTPLGGGRRQIELSAAENAFFTGFSLERAQLQLDGLAPRRFEAAITTKNRDLGALVPDLSAELLTVAGSLSAGISADFTNNLKTFRIQAASNALTIGLGARRDRWTNSRELLVVSDGRTATLIPTRLSPVTRDAPARDPRRLGAETDQGLEACGSVDLRTLALDLQVAFDLELGLAPGLPEVMSVARGRLQSREDTAAQAKVGDATCLSRADFVHIGGTARSPAPVGRLGTRSLVLVPRGSGRELRLRDGSAVLVRSRGPGRVDLELGRDGTRFEGDLDDGSFGLSGSIELVEWYPEALDLRLVGADLFLQSPGEFAITASPLGRVVGTDLRADPKLAITGDLSVSEGRFSKSFDTFARALSGAIGVRPDTPSTSVLDAAPWIQATRLDVNVLSNDFAIQTALPLARTDLRARLDLTLRGSVGQPQLFRRVDILPGGTLSYFVFERTFTVTQGSVDFDGDPERPLVDVTAQTQITYLQRAQTALQEEDEKEVDITLRMTGRVPDLKIELSSDDATFDQADIQSLLITGKPRGDLDRAQESQLVSADLATVINDVFSAPFVRRASVGVDQKGGLEYRLGTCFAPGLCFDTTTVSDDTETTLRAKFSLAIGDDVVCEGTLRRSDGAATSTQDTYQARCRYRIPLE